MVTGLSLAVLLSAGCHRDMPVTDTGRRPSASSGRLAGTVRGSDGAAMMISGRTVEIVNVATGERRTTETTSSGGFTIEVPAGTYRVELALREGETVLNRPDEVSLAYGDVDSHIELILAPAKAQRPRGPAYRLDNGLGSPTA